MTIERAFQLIAEARKAAAALVALLSLLLAQGILSDPYDKWAAGIVAALGGWAVFRIPNADPAKPGTGTAPEPSEPEQTHPVD